ncbi:MAG: hypothetical protein PHE15_02820 [Dehalococcoidales bacterium]|nr:hypothetical protein [Dehalococcoidales bacterium]
MKEPKEAPTPEEIVNSIRDAFVKDVKPDWDRWNAIKKQPCPNRGEKMDKQLKEWRIFAKEVCPYRTRDVARKSIGNPLCSVLHPCIKRCTYSRCSFAKKEAKSKE